MLREGPREILGGAVLFVGSGAYLYGALQFKLGTALRMGAGYFPMLIGIITMLVALGIIGRGLAVMRATRSDNAKETPPLALRPLLAISASIVAFALTIQWLGLIPATAASTILAAAGDRRSTVMGTLALTAALCFGTWLVFVVILGLQIPVLEIGG